MVGTTEDRKASAWIMKAEAVGKSTILKGGGRFTLNPVEPELIGEVGAPAEPELDERELALAAGLEKIGMFDLMLWAFNTEMVRSSCGSSIFAKASHSSMAHLMAVGMSGVMIGADGGGYVSPSCHDDALEVFLAVSRIIAAREASAVNTAKPKLTPSDALDGDWAARDTDMVRHSRNHMAIHKELAGRPVAETREQDAREGALQLLIHQTEKRKAPPPWEVDTPPLKVGPVLKANGKPKTIRGESGSYMGRPVASLLRYTGYTTEQAESLQCAARARYADWVSLLDEVAHTLKEDGDPLKRWRINGLGVPREPWEKLSASAA